VRRRYAGASPKKPDQISPFPVVWLRAEDLGLADGAGVSSWTDRALLASARTWVQAVSGNQPVFHTSAGAQSPNGMPYLDFVRANAPELDASGDLAMLRKKTALTLFVVARIVSPNTTRNLLTVNQNGGTGTVRYAFGFPTDNANTLKGAANDGVSGNTGMESQFWNQAGGSNGQVWAVFIQRRSYVHNKHEQWRNGIRIGGANYSGTSPNVTSDTDSAGARISGGSTEAVGGQLAEMALWDWWLTRAQIKGLMKYARGRYNLPGVPI
jgi:hypothetical protein